MRTLLVYVLIFMVASFLANLWLTRHQASGQAPVLEAVAINGELASLDYSTYQRPVVVYFFADWCPICRFQHDVISSVGQDYPVLAIAMQSSNDQALKQYLQQHEFNLPVINDTQGVLSRSFGVQGVPAVFVIQNDGQIAFSTRGYISQAGLLARLWLARVL